MQLRYREIITLKQIIKEKQKNGTYVNKYKDINTYKVQIQELTDEISASIYGATINKMFRVNSIKHVLETYLKSKANNKIDNLSKYCILYDNMIYKISTVRKEWIDIEYKEGQ